MDKLHLAESNYCCHFLSADKAVRLFPSVEFSEEERHSGVRWSVKTSDTKEAASRY